MLRAFRACEFCLKAHHDDLLHAWSGAVPGQTPDLVFELELVVQSFGRNLALDDPVRCPPETLLKELALVKHTGHRATESIDPPLSYRGNRQRFLAIQAKLKQQKADQQKNQQKGGDRSEKLTLSPETL